MKKLITTTLFLLLFSCIFAQTTFTTNGIYYYKTSTSTVDVINTNGPDAGWTATYTGSITIPSTVDYSGVTYNVTGIRGSAFSGCTGLTSLTIPSSVTSIGSFAFTGCTSLASITIPSSVTSTGMSTFEGSLWYNSQPDGLVYVGKVIYAYKGTMPANTSIALNEGTTTFGISAFSGCTGLASISIPSSVTSIGYGAFRGCTGLTSITIPSTVTSIYCAFEVCTGLTSITIPSTVTSITDSFSGCVNLKKIVAPADLLNELAASSCSGLDSVIIYSGTLTQQGLDVLNYSNRTLRYLDLKETSNTELSDEFLYNFYSLENIVLPKNLQKTHYKEYTACMALKAITIPASVTEIGQRTFEDCRSLKSVAFEANSQLKSIDNWAFYACHGLQSLTIPNGVTTIGDGAFWGCDYLTNVSLPSSVQSISDNGFEGCISMNKMTIGSSIPPTISTNTFNKVNKNIPLLVPDASVSLYKSAFGWKDFSNIKGATTVLTNIEEWNYSISITNKTIEISNATGKSIKVFDVSGRKVYKNSNAQANEQFRVYNQGVYIIAIDNLKKKVIVE